MTTNTALLRELERYRASLALPAEPAPGEGVRWSRPSTRPGVARR